MEKPDAPKGAAEPPDAAGLAPAAVGICVICQSPVDDGETVTCSDCGARYHRECRDYNGGCGVYGCPQAPPTEDLNSLEIQPSYWGKEDKPCPACGQTILAVALRCRYCGVIFSSAAPRDAASFRSEQSIISKLPGLRKASLWLLILSFIPLTAPLAVIIGVPWYLSNREAIGQLTAVNSALCKLAIGVAVMQTSLFVVVGILYSAIGA